MVADDLAARPDLAQIRLRVRQKCEDYERYNFTREQNALLRTFFDLAQEYDTLQDFYRVCVSALLEYMALESRLYLFDEKGDQLQLVCDSVNGVHYDKEPAAPVAAAIHPADAPYETGNSYVVPIYRKRAHLYESAPEHEQGHLLGLFEIYPLLQLTEADRFFLIKYANRIGVNLHNRILAHQHVQHIRFINNLVTDIEHNVITPNIYFRHIFNKLRKSIEEMEELERLIASFKESGAGGGDTCEMVVNRVSNLHQELIRHHRELQEHHATTSLFLESLLRREHFAKGHLVLQPRYCHIVKEIITPLLEHFASRFASRGITVEPPADMVSEGFPLMVDVGLLSQVYANLFSNAVKYTEEVIDHQGRPRKAVAYGREIIHDYFGPGVDGIKFNVFSTGSHLKPEEAQHIFTDGFRGDNRGGLPGTGHGLSFVREVVEVHGGQVGYEATAQGNNFYFILPLPTKELPVSFVRR